MDQRGGFKGAGEGLANTGGEPHAGHGTWAAEVDMRHQIGGSRNSAGVPTPKGVAESGRLPNMGPRSRYTLAELLVGMTPETMGEAFTWGEDQGREAVT